MHTAGRTVDNPSKIPGIGVRAEKAGPGIVHSAVFAPPVAQGLPANMAKRSPTIPDILLAVGTYWRGAMPCSKAKESKEPNHRHRCRRRQRAQLEGKESGDEQHQSVAIHI